MKSTFTIFIAVLAIVSVSSKVLLPGDFSVKKEQSPVVFADTTVNPDPDTTTVQPDPEDTTTVKPDPEDTTTVKPDPEDTTTVKPDPEDTTTGNIDPEDTTTNEEPDTTTTAEPDITTGAAAISVTTFLVLLSAISMKL